MELTNKKEEQDFERLLRRTVSEITVPKETKERIWQKIKQQIEGEQK
jgi:hypothetical protein